MTPDLLGSLPVGAVVPQLLGALERAGTAVLQAPPGTGKTTLVPLALAGALPGGRVVVAEPRRVAARAAAARSAALLGEEVGARVGFAVRGERRTSAATRVEVVTTGLLLRRLLRDPELPGIAALVLDEVHERHLDTDLALALALESRAVLRPDLRLLCASATVEADRVAALLGGSGPSAPVVTATAAVHPLDVRWCPPPRPVRPPEGLRVDPALLDHVAALTATALADLAGDVLVFLPGAGEVSAVAARLHRLPVARDVDVVALHGRLGAREQDAALRPGTRRRVVLATAVAESSLTVPGVRVVVDAGLARVPRTDHARGLAGLDTVRVSRAAADQRAGRAAREAPGTVLRAWSRADHALLPAHPDPEITTADLSAFALTSAAWGAGEDLPLLDPPPPGPLAAAHRTLRVLGALDDDGRVTALGRALAGTGLHPRLARALHEGAPRVGRRRCAEVVALLSEDGLARGTDDLVAAWRRLRAQPGSPDARRWEAEVRRLLRELPAGPEQRGDGRGDGTGGPPDDLAAGEVVALAHPERIARRRGAGLLTVGGGGLETAPGSAWEGAAWLAVAEADAGIGTGRAAGRVRLAAPLDEATALRVAARERARDEEVVWREERVVAERVDRLGAVVLSRSPLPRPDPDAVTAVLLDVLHRDGLARLGWSPAGRSLRARLAACRAALGEPWPDVRTAALLERAGEWLLPALAGVRTARDLAAVDAGAALRALLPWPAAARLDELAPEAVAVPSGRRARLTWPEDPPRDGEDPAPPVLAVKLQEVFGWTASPRVLDGRVAVVLHLLSPAGRPLAVTSDLASFWAGPYAQVRAENRGRYPKHPWPQDPLTATATSRTTRAAGRTYDHGS
ncbi:ATP-dependent helicase HrpB [Kineococcus sp. SYSU DK004]|uniref:ATP-dependent helicase HrpB n=1 Tax=Kineococcus sp. SYSU DK004 TaxID=3383125 RepID=UPI003D7D7C9F